jgi:hypothetical protein
MKKITLIVLILSSLFSCIQENNNKDAIARVYDSFLFEKDLEAVLPQNLSKEDSVLFRTNYINAWATEQLLLQKATLNIADEDGEIKDLVETYRKELLIDKYKQAVLQQDLDTLVQEEDIEKYYQKNKGIYKLNEDLVQLRYIYFDKNRKDEKELIKLFQSNENEDRNQLLEKELEFKSFNFNDSIWVSVNLVLEKLPVLKEDEKIKKENFIQKEDSLGVYLVAVKDVLYRNDIAPKSYVVPTIKQMILHKRKLELIKKIEQTLVNDAIKKKQFENFK